MIEGPQFSDNQRAILEFASLWENGNGWFTARDIKENVDLDESVGKPNLDRINRTIQAMKRHIHPGLFKVRRRHKFPEYKMGNGPFTACLKFAGETSPRTGVDDDLIGPEYSVVWTYEMPPVETAAEIGVVVTNFLNGHPEFTNPPFSVMVIVPDRMIYMSNFLGQGMIRMIYPMAQIKFFDDDLDDIEDSELYEHLSEDEDDEDEDDDDEDEDEDGEDEDEDDDDEGDEEDEDNDSDSESDGECALFAIEKEDGERRYVTREEFRCLVQTFL